ncbi:MAG: hypothetical protein JO267_03385 [Alphaproteobacteria bacterium]|nr:hypothetical protein [Alphaproteobacteria bacterium]
MKSQSIHQELLYIEGGIFRCRYESRDTTVIVSCTPPPLLALGAMMGQARAAARKAIRGWLNGAGMREPGGLEHAEASALRLDISRHDRT